MEKLRIFYIFASNIRLLDYAQIKGKMDNFQIETAQNINIKQNVAHLSTRIGSYLLDLLIIVLYSALTIWIMNAIGYPPSLDAMVAYTLLGLPVFLYSLIFEVLTNGQTPGKMINKLRVVNLDGSKPTFVGYLMRWLLKFIDIDIAGGSVAILSILLNGKGQRLGDIAAGTTVISERKKITLKDTLAEDLPENYQPTYAQVILLNDVDIQTIKTLYAKAKRKNSHDVMIGLSNKIIEITDIKTNQYPRDFVQTVIKDYLYYTQ